MRCLMDGNVNEGFVIEIGVKFNPVLLDECEAPDARIALELKAHLPHGYILRPMAARTLPNLPDRKPASEATPIMAHFAPLA